MNVGVFVVVLFELLDELELPLELLLFEPLEVLVFSFIVILKVFVPVIFCLLSSKSVISEAVAVIVTLPALVALYFIVVDALSKNSFVFPEKYGKIGGI